MVIFHSYVSLPEGNMGMNQNLSFTIVLGKFHHDRTLVSRTLEIMVRIREIIPFYGRTIQVSEIL